MRYLIKDNFFIKTTITEDVNLNLNIIYYVQSPLQFFNFKRILTIKILNLNNPLTSWQKYVIFDAIVRITQLSGRN